MTSKDLDELYRTQRDLGFAFERVSEAIHKFHFYVSPIAFVNLQRTQEYICFARRDLRLAIEEIEKEVEE